MSLAERSRPFLDYLEELASSWEVQSFQALVEEAGGPDRVALASVDIVKGFCDRGPLASERVGAVVEPATRLLRRAWELGVRHLVFPQDCHPPDSPEFQAWPPHCVEGTEEADMVDAFRELAFAGAFTVLPKASVNCFLDTGLADWFARRPGLTRVVAIGVVTDICLYQLALGLRCLANTRRYPWEVVVPACGTRTYDLSPQAAREAGALPHDGELLQRIFLYHLQLNGVRVVRDLV